MYYAVLSEVAVNFVCPA